MPNCAVCDIELQPQQKTCHICGSATADIAASSPAGSTSGPASIPDPVPSQPDLGSGPVESVSNDRECPACGRVFDSRHQDEFCPCGTELRPRSGPADPTDAAPPPPIPLATPVPPVEAAGASRPAAGTICLVVYSETKPRQPIRYVPISKDVLLIGREDAVRGDFPDLDLSSLLDESTAKKVSRRHAELLRARDSQSFLLRPLPGNTGTQVGKELASPGQNYPLTDGIPIVLGGVVWMKFETIK